MTLFKSFLLCLIIISYPLSSFAQQCDISYDEKSGLFSVFSNSKKIISTHYSFWGKDWNWVGSTVTSNTEREKLYNFDVDMKALNINLNGKTTVSEPNQMNWDYRLHSTKAHNGIIGGGIVFRLDLSEIDGNSVKLLPNNTGWIIDNEVGCGPFTVRFSEPVQTVYFERGNPSEIRAFFYDKQVIPETKTNRMTVTLPVSGKVKATIAEQLGEEPDTRWIKDIMDHAYSPVDLSFMNANDIPAGKRGFVKAQGENLVFEDGTIAKFWGTNIQAYALFKTSPSEMKRHAKRLSQLGFNLVRIHHHDSGWVVPNIFGNNEADTLSLNRESMKLLDLWIKILKDEGIYIWLDLAVGREYSIKDGIENFTEISKGKDKTVAKGFNYINDSIQMRMKEFNEAYLNHVNEYTSLAYKDDPAIISMLITNENDLTHHFGNALLPDKNVPKSNALYMKLAEDFAKKNGLSVDKTWRSWEHGPSKIFLNDLEHNFNKTMIDHLANLGVKVPITTTNSWGAMPLSGLPSLTDGDIIDVHSYGDGDFFKTNPRFKDNFINWIGAGQINGKPLSVTEWNIGDRPSFDRFSSPVYLAALSAFQGWDALMQYGYSQMSLNNEGRQDNWSVYNDPGAMALMPVAALLYRQDHVSKAKKTYALQINKDDFFNRKTDPSNAASIRTIMEQSKLVIDLPETTELNWLTPAPLSGDSMIINEIDKDFLPEGQTHVLSDTGELKRDWQNGIYTINTKQSQISMGWIGDKEIILDDVKIALENNYGAVAVQSLDEKPITNAETLLVSLASRTVPSENGRRPYLSEPLKGNIQINAKEGLKLYALTKYGKEFEFPMTYANGTYQITLDDSLKTYWLILK